MNDGSSTKNFGLVKVIEDAKAVIIGPVAFYRSMPTIGGYAEPAIFVAVMGVALGLVVVLFSLFGASPVGVFAAGLAAIIMMPIFSVIGSFIGALIMFVIWKLMGSSETYESAYRSVAYATAIYPIMGLLGLVPYVGTIVGVVWGFYLMFNATVEVHKIERKKAIMVIGILGALVLFMQVSGEIASRKMQARVEAMGGSMEDFGKAMENYTGADEEMTPEEAGKAVGDFLRGMNEAIEKGEREEAEE